MNSVVLDDDGPIDDYAAPRLRFNAAPEYCIEAQYRVNDSQTFSDAASCESPRSPTYRACGCRDAEETPKTPADSAAGPFQYFHQPYQRRRRQQQQQQQPASFAIHQLLGLGANIRELQVNYDRQTADARHPPTPCRCADCNQSFNPVVDSSPLFPPYLGPHQVDIASYYDRPSSAVSLYRQHHGPTAAVTSRWPHLRQPFQITPPTLKSWSNGEPHLSKKTVVHHEQQLQDPSHHYDELQAYYCATRLQPSDSVDVTSYDNVIRQCRNVSYLPPNFCMYCMYIIRTDERIR